MKIIILILLFSSKVMAINPSEIFTFEDNFSCNEKFPHHSFCTASGFKKWKDEEKSEVESILKKYNRPELANFFKIIKEKGYKKFYRISHATRWYNNHQKRIVMFSKESERPLLFVNPVTHIVGFMDEFFENENRTDLYSDLSKKELNVFHELVHIYDIARNHVSNRDDVKNAIGWYWNGKEHVLKDIDNKKAIEDFYKIAQLSKKGQKQLFYNLLRDQGIELGLPTLYAAFNSHECFAELMTYFVFDPTAKNYLTDEIQRVLIKLLKET